MNFINKVRRHQDQAPKTTTALFWKLYLRMSRQRSLRGTLTVDTVSESRSLVRSIDGSKALSGIGSVRLTSISFVSCYEASKW